MLQNLIEGKTKQSKLKFDQLIKHLGKSPNIAWYPSAGLDFRDLIEVNRTAIKPDLHIHTDYDLKSTKLELGEVFNDKKTKVSICNIEELQFKNSIDFFVNPEFVVFPENAPRKPLIFLLDVTIELKGPKINKPVLYIYMENICF